MSFSYAKLISLNLYILNKIYKNLCYNHYMGFGDSFCYYIAYYNKIKKMLIDNLLVVKNINSLVSFRLGGPHLANHASNKKKLSIT